MYIWSKCTVAEHCKSHRVIEHFCHKSIIYDLPDNNINKIHNWKYFL